MRISNFLSHSKDDLLSKGLFAGVDIGESANTADNDVCTVLWKDANSGWMIESNQAGDCKTDFFKFFSELPEKAQSLNKKYLVLCIDACLSKPAKPHYYNRDCEKELNNKLESGLSWQGRSYHKAIDLLNAMPLHGVRKRIILETHPQSNFKLYDPGMNRKHEKSANKEAEYLSKLLELLCETNTDGITNWDQVNAICGAEEPHFRDSLMAALVAVAYGRWKSGIREDYLTTVLDHDGVYWLIDAARVRRKLRSRAKQPLNPQ